MKTQACLMIVVATGFASVAHAQANENENGMFDKNGLYSDELQGSKGQGFGFPMYRMGKVALKAALKDQVHSSEQQAEDLDIPPLDMAKFSESVNAEMHFDENQAENDNPEFFETDKFRGLNKWVAKMRAEYETSAQEYDNDYDEAQVKESSQDEAQVKERSQDDSKRNLNVFLPNGLRVMTQTDMDAYPARTVGRFVTGGGWCSATIISRDLVLTNRHCLGLSWDNKLPDNFWSSTYLQVGYTAGEFNYKAYFGRVRWSSTVNDYAILQMLEPLGLYTGWPGIQFRDIWHFVNTERQLSYIGYSGILGGNAGGDFACKSRNGLFEWVDVIHDCDATRGSSGSAMMTGLRYPVETSSDPYIVALNFGEFRYGDTSLTLAGWDWLYRNLAKPASVFRGDYYVARDWAPFPTKAPTPFPTTATTSPTPRPSLGLGISLPPFAVTLPPGIGAFRPTPQPTFRVPFVMGRRLRGKADSEEDTTAAV